MGIGKLILVAGLLATLLLGGCESSGGGASDSEGAAWTTPLPAYNGTLSGGNLVRVRNLNDFDIRVGLRSGGRGMNFVVPARDTEEVDVPDGRYDVFLQYAVDRTGVYRGDSFSLNGNGMEYEVKRAAEGARGAQRVR